MMSIEYPFSNYESLDLEATRLAYETSKVISDDKNAFLEALEIATSPSFTEHLPVTWTKNYWDSYYKAIRLLSELVKNTAGAIPYGWVSKSHAGNVGWDEKRREECIRQALAIAINSCRQQ